MFNKQKDLFAAIPLTIFVMIVCGLSIVEYLTIARAVRSDHLTYGGIVAKENVYAQLPVPVHFPVQRAEFSDFDSNPTSAHIVIDVVSGRTLFAHNAYTHRAVASTTKMLAAMVVADRTRDLGDVIDVPEAALSIEGTRVGCKNSYYCEGQRLVAGERVRVRDLLRATLVSSANDAVTALAIHIAGSEEAFAELMNLRARELGLTSSQHCRPSGLDLSGEATSLEKEGKKCYSTAYDMAHTLRQIYIKDRYEELRGMFAERGAMITSEDGSLTHALTSTNDALDSEGGLIIAGKTGYTELAGPSLVVRAENQEGERPIIIATFNDQERFARVEEIAQWVYSSFEWL